MSADRFVAGPDDMLVRWFDCWILPSLLGRLKEAALLLPEDEREDVHAALVKAVKHKTVRALQDIPSRLVRALGL